MGTDTEQALRWWRVMNRIRTFEELIGAAAASKELPGYVHLCTGQEAVAVGAIDVLQDDDWLTSTYRNHGHAIARGVELTSVASELWGRADGVCAGRGGSMHVADQNLGMIGSFGLIAAGLPIAAGAAWAAQYRGEPRVAMGFFGDGAVNHGWWHEAMGFASLFEVGVVYVCEHNLYAEATAADYHMVARSIPSMAEGYGIAAVSVDGMDVEAVNIAVAEAVDRARDGGGPSVVEARTYRFAGQYEGDTQSYKPPAEVAEWRDRDPLKLLRVKLGGHPDITEDQLDDIVADELQAAQMAVDHARQAPFPDAKTMPLGLFTNADEEIPWLAN